MKFRNLTPHQINLCGQTFESEGIARVSVTEEVVDITNDITVVREVFGNVIGLPDAQKDTLLIVSRMVKAALPMRNDLVSPTRFVRNDAGQITGAGAVVK